MNNLVYLGEAAPYVYPNQKRIDIKGKYRCYCGKEFEARVKHVENGKRTSCGCYTIKVNKERHITHGMTESKIYGVWCGIKRRCTNKNEKSYKDYGGRGIKVCKRWLNSFENFYNDMHKGYKEGLEIDRKQNSGNYCKSNCRWVKRAKNAQNKRTNKIIEYYGVKLPMVQFCKKFHINYNNFQARLLRGMSIKEAIEKPYRK